MSINQHLPVAHVANVSFITPTLAIGGDLDPWGERGPAQLAELVSLGLTHIADVRIEWSDEELVAELAPSVAYLHHGIDDAGQQVPYRWFEEGVQWITAGLKGGGVVLAHCHMGINRGPSLGYATLLGLGWDPIEALDTIRWARPIAAIGYAEDALAWHLERTGSSPCEWRVQRRRLSAWRSENELDVTTIIRKLRHTGA